MPVPPMLISGSLAFDTIMDFDGVFSDHILPEKLHTLSVSFLVNDVVRHDGGTAGNIAYTLALLRCRSTIVACLGHDGAQYRKRLATLGVDVDSIPIVAKRRTAAAWIMTDKKDNQITAFHPGAMDVPVPSSSLWRTHRYSVALCAPGNAIDRRRTTQWARSHNVPFIFDPGQTLTAMSAGDVEQCMRKSCATIVNDYELDLLLQILKVSKASLHRLTGVLITTLGERGSVIELLNTALAFRPLERKCQRTRADIAALSSRALIDPTGAGDAYRAGLLAGLSQGMDWHMSAQVAATAAVYAVETQGTQEHRFTPRTFQERYRRAFWSRCPLTF